MAGGGIRVIGSDAVVRRLSEISSPATRRLILEGIGAVGVRSIQRGIREQRSPDGKPYPPLKRYGKPGQRLRDTGRFINMIAFEVVSGSRVRIGSNHIAAPTQHFGDANRTPKTAKYLAIPLTAQVARAVAGRGFRAAFPDGFVLRAKSGTLFIARRKGKKSGKLELLAVLKKSVAIPGTGFVGISPRGQGEMVAHAERVIRRQVEGGQK